MSDWKDVTVAVAFFAAVIVTCLVGRGCNKDKQQHDLDMERAKLCPSAVPR